MDFFVFLPAVTFTFDLLTPKSNQHIDEPKYIGNPNLEKDHFICFWDMVFQKFSGCTDSLTDEQTRLQNVSGTVFQWWHRQ